MRETANDRNRPKSALRWQLLALALCTGLGLGALPAFSQDSNNQDEVFQTTGGKKKHRKRQERPIMLGTSGSNAEDMTVVGNLRFCCNGTLGALVEKAGIQYVLSNNHVLGRSNSAKKGEAIIQPGYSDQACPASDEDFDTVALFSAKKKIKFGADKNNKVDLAIAEVVPGAVRSNGEVLRIGVPGTTPVEAFVGLEVQKAGRTTGVTRGFVESVHNSVIIPEFPLTCGGSETRLARFSNQIFVRSINDSDFERSGDSGSMVFEDVDVCPAPVGLLFAGGGGLAALNPAATVLKFVRKLKPRGPATFVGCESSAMEVASLRSPLLQPARVREAAGVKQNWEDHLLNLPNVQSLGIGMTLTGPVEPAIYLYTIGSREEMLEQVPESLDGFRIEVIETNKFEVRCGQNAPS